MCADPICLLQYEQRDSLEKRHHGMYTTHTVFSMARLTGGVCVVLQVFTLLRAAYCPRLLCLQELSEIAIYIEGIFENSEPIHFFTEVEAGQPGHQQQCCARSGCSRTACVCRHFPCSPKGNPVCAYTGGFGS